MLNNLLQIHLKEIFKKTVETTGDSIGYKIADKITENVSRSSPQYSSEAIESETENTGFDRKIPKEKYLRIYVFRKMTKSY